MAAPDHVEDPRAAARAEIREFLSTRRARITPQEAGLPEYGHERRRVTGLRREEVALLAGVSPQYYTRLERGDAPGISESIIDGVANALQLDDAERTHLLHLLHTAGATRGPRRRTLAAQLRVRPTIQRLVDSMFNTPAVVLNGRLEIVTANVLGRALFAPVYAEARNESGTAEQRPVRLPRLPSEGLLPGVGHRRQRHRRHPARRSRPRPLRPGPVRPRWAAVHPQRGLPPPVGRPRRAPPCHRHQALPPPRRRRPRPALRVPPLCAGIEHQLGRVHPRPTIPQPRHPRPPCQLGRYKQARR